MSDSDGNDSSDGDFSASEDEWKPGKNEYESTEEEDDDFLSNEEDLPKSTEKQKSKPKMTKKLTNKALRIKMFQKYKTASASLLNKSQQSQPNFPNIDDSDSSVDDHLVNINSLDLKSSFFTPSNKPQNPPPDFDCNIGLRLSDSEEEADDLSNIVNDSQSNFLCGANPKQAAPNIDFSQHQKFTANLEAAKSQLANFKAKPITDDSKIDVTKLLALGEPSSSEPIRRMPTKKHGKSDSDWEEVDDFDDVQHTVSDVQITVGPSIVAVKKSSKEKDIHAALKRRINQRKREIQLLIHKVHILSLIAHGNYVNSVLNNSDLMKLCLDLLPSSQCYPKSRTDLKYFEQISKWYGTKINLKNNSMYSKLTRTPPLPISLGLQIKTKAAICRRDFILIFIILLRSLGLQCRLVINLVTEPIRPPASQLCSFTEKKESNVISKKQNTEQIITLENDKKNVKQVTCSRKSNFKEVSEKTKTQTESPKKMDIQINKDLKQASLKNTKETSQKTKIQRKSYKDKEEKPNYLGKKLETNLKNVRETKPLASPKVISPPISSRTRKRPICKETDQLLSLNEPNKVASKEKLTENIKDHKSKKKETELNQNTAIENSQATSSNPSTSKVYSPVFSSNKRNVLGSPIAKRTRTKINNLKNSDNSDAKFPQLDGNDDIKSCDSNKGNKPNLSKLANGRKRKQNEAETSAPPKKTKPLKTNENETSSKVLPKKEKTNAKSKQTAVSGIDRRVLSTDDENEETQPSKKNCINMWVEVYCEVEALWISVDLFKSKVHCIEAIRKTATKPMSYIFAWNSNKTIKDVSARYCTQWHTTTRKMRVEQDWLDKALKPFKEIRNATNKAEDRELNKVLLKEPLPKAISEYKNHPLYVLKRHLLKFEGIYPPNSLTLGYIRDEPVYSRDCVHTLHSREIWVKQARTVKPGEQPYKIVKARPKWNRATGSMLAPAPLEIFGYWQTQPYEPPTAENGIVPRNPYGNVELFKPEMLPYKTVHLQLSGLNKTCKKLGIDCAQAVVGFDFHSGSSHPTFDGYVICEEFAEQAVEQWWKDQEESERKVEEKYLQRVYGNWKKLIKGLIIRERLQAKYNFKAVDKDPIEKRKRKK